MALNINGTTGISGVDGSASAPALQGTDSNTGINFASDTVNINTGGSTRATIESNGRLGIGTTSPACDLHVSAANPRARFTSTGNTVNYDIFMGSTTATVGTSSNHDTVFMTNDTERMRINSAGDIMCGSTTVEVGRGNTTIGVTLRPEGRVYYNSNSSFSSFGRNADGAVLVFTRSGTDVGNISVTSSATSYNTGSDYRLKENVVSISDGITRLKTLKPKRFNFIADAETTVDGFIAHEVTAVPEAITGAKDEVDSDNNPVYQGIDQSKLVPLLTAALQEAVAKIEVLETENTQMKTDLTALTARVTALEAG